MLELIALVLIILVLTCLVGLMVWRARRFVLVPDHDHAFDQIVGDGKGWRCSFCADHGVYVYKGKG